MKVNISCWQQIKYNAYRYYLVEDRFLNGYLYAAVLGAAGMCISISNHMDVIYTLASAFGVISMLFQPFLFNHWDAFKGKTLTINLNGDLLYIRKNGLTYGIDLSHHSFKKIVGYYVLTAGDQIFFFSKSQFEELKNF